VLREERSESITALPPFKTLAIWSDWMNECCWRELHLMAIP
jgi:hypothetical protein